MNLTLRRLKTFGVIELLATPAQVTLLAWINTIRLISISSSPLEFSSERDASPPESSDLLCLRFIGSLGHLRDAFGHAKPRHEGTMPDARFSNKLLLWLLRCLGVRSDPLSVGWCDWCSTTDRLWRSLATGVVVYFMIFSLFAYSYQTLRRYVARPRPATDQ